MNKQQLLDLQFIEMRHLVVELAAFLDRVDRSTGDEDFRIQSLRRAILVLSEPHGSRAKEVLDALSDKSTTATAGKAGPAACGAPLPTE